MCLVGRGGGGELYRNKEAVTNGFFQILFCFVYPQGASTWRFPVLYVVMYSCSWILFTVTLYAIPLTVNFVSSIQYFYFFR
ncbi:hypothetical protein BGX38DRAFT_1209728 [Terfezia claveryi]|nr:hypothetical protein BGX38DRAFT_1209728 [Terfezia claveryi]